MSLFTKDLFDNHAVSRRSLLGGIAATSALVMLHPFAARASATRRICG
jgi:2',3'-cyclic-nucleotide 2'-phosphodiesterase/3'-nucleotidase